MEEIENKIDEIEAIKNKIENFEVDPDDYIDMYNGMLDECYDNFMGSYSPSRTFESIDPIAYRCGLLDYVDSLSITPPDEWDTELSDLLEELEYLLDNEEEWCEDMIKDLQQDVENGDEDADVEITIYLERIDNIKSWRKEYV